MIDYVLKKDLAPLQLSGESSFILYWVQYPDACVVIPAKAGIQNLDASVRWHDKYLAACGEDYLFMFEQRDFSCIFISKMGLYGKEENL